MLLSSSSVHAGRGTGLTDDRHQRSSNGLAKYACRPAHSCTRTLRVMFGAFTFRTGLLLSRRCWSGAFLSYFNFCLTVWKLLLKIEWKWLEFSIPLKCLTRVKSLNFDKTAMWQVITIMIMPGKTRRFDRHTSVVCLQGRPGISAISRHHHSQLRCRTTLS